MEIGKSYLMERFNDTVWMLEPNKLAMISNLLVSKLKGESLNLVGDNNKENESPMVQKYSQSISILNIEGKLLPKCSYLDAMSGFQSTLETHLAFNSLVEDPKVERIVLYVDTPGGSTIGIPELAEAIYNARDKKEIVSFTDVASCSAGYYIASAAEKVICTPSSVIGSIGCYMALIKQKNLDYEVNYIQAGDNKTFGSPDTETSVEEINFFQDRIDSLYDSMTLDISKYRNIEQRVVKETQASFYTSKDAPKWMYDELADINYIFS